MNESVVGNEMTYVFDGGGGGGAVLDATVEGASETYLGNEDHLNWNTVRDVYNNSNTVQASIIGLICGLIVISNLIIILSLRHINAGREILDYYLLSLATVDLILGSLIGPLSLYAAVIGDWIYGDLLCRLMGYLEISLWIVTIYTFMWISVDRYLSIKKPFRYDVLQTKTRSQCWMVFTWISALMICSPPLLNYHKPLYDHESFLCYLDWSDMVAYAVTLSILVLGPSLMTIIFCYAYILRVLKKLQRADPMIMHDKELASALSDNISNPSHLMTTILILVFWLSWMPYIVVNCYEFFFRVRFQIPFLHFIVAWLGVLNSFWKLLILLLFSARFRVATRIFCLRLCCQSRNQFHDQLVDFDFDMEFDEFHNS